MMNLPDMSPNLKATFAGIFGLLITASLLTAIFRRKLGEKTHTELKQRIKSWWAMIAVFTLAIAFSRNISLVFFCFLSFLALKEYLSLIPTRRADRRVLFWAYLTIPLHYYWIYLGWYGMFIIFIPVYVSALIPIRMVMVGETDGFVQSAGTIQWGLMKTVFALSHNAYLLVLPAAVNPNGGGPALVLYLVGLTQLNDVAQYIWGKTLGKRKVVPKVSPGKTLAGLVGGVCTTIALACLLRTVLTPFSLYEAACAGAIIGLSGFFGDVVMSAVKRDIGVKDTGSMLPGHGGILDRIDSLTYTAPLFFHYFRYLYG